MFIKQFSLKCNLKNVLKEDKIEKIIKHQGQGIQLVT